MPKTITFKQNDWIDLQEKIDLVGECPLCNEPPRFISPDMKTVCCYGKEQPFHSKATCRIPKTMNHTPIWSVYHWKENRNKN